MDKLQIFCFRENQLRTFIKDGEPWFVAKDVCSVLEITNPRDAVERLDHDEKGVVLTDTLGGKQNITYINEAGLYTLVLGSRKPEAKHFKRWVTHEVLPSIRKHGLYATDDLLNDPDLAIKAFTALKEERVKNKALKAKAEQDKPKVLFADSVTASSSSILVGDLSKIIKQNGVDIGEIRLWQWLRDKGYAIKEKGHSYNMPTQKSMDLKVMEVKEGIRMNSEGDSKITKTTLITGKGQVYFVNKFLAREASA